VTIDVDGLLAGGESDRVEFKASARWDYKELRQSKVMEQMVVKAIAAFLNAKGGALLIGVDDSGDVLGLESDYSTLGKRPDRDGYQQFLVNLIANALGKNACASLAISFHPLQAKEICLVRVSASVKPVYVEESGVSKLYVRLGNTSREIGGPEANEYVRTRWPKGTN
jgi:predicted HTH transcriptional regulator